MAQKIKGIKSGGNPRASTDGHAVSKGYESSNLVGVGSGDPVMMNPEMKRVDESAKRNMPKSLLQ